ncbi:Pantothenate kinase 4 [Echinococcus granulosus]|uniref:Pantothenate kinase 4 n=1 Tax=Echinococcus granulosus TaxID=6210 RepID=W6U8C1_ECHGR|nr:Pantothenate kinase 4 [Echinococcus granulosus]EUB56621.1 Pantothenate kinase 4 [Echinococcus granulosus]
MFAIGTVVVNPVNLVHCVQIGCPDGYHAYDYFQSSTLDCAGSINDVTYRELLFLLNEVAGLEPRLQRALEDGRLMCVDNGQSSPCLDLRQTSHRLVQLVKKEKVHCESLQVGAELLMCLENTAVSEITSLLWKGKGKCADCGTQPDRAPAREHSLVKEIGLEGETFKKSS